jgi:GH15 family glucan-1,4-alpha-glucosidase
VQSYDSDKLDASLLLIPIVGFLPASDARVAETVCGARARTAGRRLLATDLRRRKERRADRETGGGRVSGLQFLWLVDCYALAARLADARRLFENLLAIRNDVGLLAEEYDARRRRQAGKVPQALSHATLVSAAVMLEKLDES